MGPVPSFIVYSKLTTMECLRETPEGIARLCREYTGVDGVRRTAIFLEEGPSGKRWLLGDGSMVTIDIVERTYWKPFRQKLYPYSKRPWNPWEAATDIKDSWVIESP